MAMLGLQHANNHTNDQWLIGRREASNPRRLVYPANNPLVPDDHTSACLLCVITPQTLQLCQHRIRYLSHC